MILIYYRSPSGRCPALDYLQSLPEREQAQVVADLKAVELYGRLAPVQKRALKGRAAGLWEFRIGANRVIYAHVARGDTWLILGACSKKQQDREIAACVNRWKLAKERP